MDRLFLSAAHGGAILSVLMMIGCASGPEQEPKADLRPVATAREIMFAITIPASNGVWSALNEAPDTDEEWIAIEHDALALAESGNLLLMEGRAVDLGNWRTQAMALVEGGEIAAEAARTRDLELLLAIGDTLYNACVACHNDYMAARRRNRQ